MTAVWIAARAQLRRRLGATIALILLVGLAGGVVIAGVAGASRTDSAMKRFVAYSHPEDVYVSVNGPAVPGGGGVGGPPADATPEQIQAYVTATLADREQLVHLPEVARTARAPYLFMSPDKAGNEIGTINPFAAADNNAFRTIGRPLVVHGRLARPDRPDEAVVDDGTASVRHLRVGSRITMWSFSAEQNANVAGSGFGKIPAPEGPAYSFRIVGVVREPSDVSRAPASIVGDAVYQGQGAMVLTPAFLRQFAADQGLPTVEAMPGIEGFRVRLQHGLADLPAFKERLAALHVQPADVHIGSDVTSAAEKAQRAIHLEAVALLLFAGLAGVAALLLVGQALARQVVADTIDNPTLAALGLGRRQLVLVALIRAGVIAIGGAALAVLVAIGLSPFAPIGLARRAEIHPGLSVNVAALAVGFLAVAGVVVLRALVPAWRAAHTLSRTLEQAPARPGRLTAAVAGSGLGPAAIAGVGMSFERGRSLAFRTALLGSAVAVAGVVAAVTFGVSLTHLVDSPRQQGWNWDVVVGNPNSADAFTDDAEGAKAIRDHMEALLAANGNVSEYSALATSDAIGVDGHQVDLAGMDPVRGSVWQPIVEGRAPAADDEIVLGRDPLRQLHRRLGQTVVLQAPGHSMTMRIVGVSLQPTAGDLSTRLSGGGGITLGALEQLVPNTPVVQFAVRYRPGVGRHTAFASLVNDFGREVLQPYPGGEVGDLGRVDFLPYALAGLLVILAVGALGITLLSSVRHHDRDLAVLKTIGFVRGQVSATVAWQATVLGVGAVVVGIPVGVAIGRWTWRLVADGVGSVAPPIVPMAAVLAVAPVTLVVANLLAGGPAWAAGRVQPARVLKAE